MIIGKCLYRETPYSNICGKETLGRTKIKCYCGHQSDRKSCAYKRMLQRAREECNRKYAKIAKKPKGTTKEILDEFRACPNAFDWLQA